MRIICDTHVLLFWVDCKDRLSRTSKITIETSLKERKLACSDISLWEIAMLFAHGRLNTPAGVSPEIYMEDIVKSMALAVLPITPKIASLSQQTGFPHKDPADRLIAATAISHNAPLITADRKLRNIEGLTTIW